ncbi:MAG TPA: transcription termination/antitermination NusG family protein [Thermodesulfovibrionales bacterium]|nr:transcription termination/antitermination NusG family protein [Thermodesulfovibrionales bacterium]
MSNKATIHGTGKTLETNNERAWYALYTKPKSENAVVTLLNNAGIETLNPKIQIRKFVKGKYMLVLEHLFPSYIFAFLNREEESHMAKYTRGVKYIVGKENPVMVPPEIIDSIKERLEGDIIREIPENLKKGDRVLIKDGPFKDFYGIFERVLPGKERSIILLEALYSRLDIPISSLRRS